MLKTIYYSTRKDGVRLFLTADFKVDEKGEPVKDKYGRFVLLNYIHQNETGHEYDMAYDVEGAAYTYSVTDKPIE